MPLRSILARGSRLISLLPRQLMYVCVARVETGGRLWRVVINRTLLAVVRLFSYLCWLRSCPDLLFDCFDYRP